MSAFETALAFSARWEGGFVDDPADPGGATRYGITRGTLAKWRGRPVTAEEVSQLPVSEAKRIYEVWYWDAVSGNDLPLPLALLVFDWGINSGPARAAIRLQKVANTFGKRLVVDGAIGPATCKAITEIKEVGQLRALMVAYLRARLWFYRGLITFPRFGGGWHNRTVDAAIEAGRWLEN